MTWHDRISPHVKNNFSHNPLSISSPVLPSNIFQNLKLTPQTSVATLWLIKQGLGAVGQMRSNEEKQGNNVHSTYHK